MATGFLGAIVLAVLIVLGVYWVYENVEIKRRPRDGEDD